VVVPAANGGGGQVCGAHGEAEQQAIPQTQWQTGVDQEVEQHRVAQVLPATACTILLISHHRVACARYSKFFGDIGTTCRYRGLGG
jgi:hypothetical protein